MSSSAEWSRQIKAQLLVADIFLPLLTDNFPNSKWTDQETGMAIASDKLIVPLKVDLNPHGFAGAIQALLLDPHNVQAACAKITKTIAKNPRLREGFLDGLIKMFSESFSFEDAAAKATLLVQFDGYTPQQVRQVLLAIVANDQIHKSFKAQRRMANFIASYGSQAEPALVKKARAAMR